VSKTVFARLTDTQTGCRIFTQLPFYIDIIVNSGMKQLDALPFVKYSATGNDFILIDNRHIGIESMDRDWVRKVCQRRTSIGADGILLLDNHQNYDFSVRYFNSDGSETECGNGARAAALFAKTARLTSNSEGIRFLFGDNVYTATVDGRAVTIRMPLACDFRQDLNLAQAAGLRHVGFVHVGVPHLVLAGKSICEIDMLKLGHKYRYHDMFKPAGTNVDVMEQLAANEIRVRTYERGVEDETRSCGTGCVASAFIANRTMGIGFPIEISTAGGRLVVRQEEGSEHLLLQGEVQPVYKGELFSA
jgi:diaminopimelate epimerase